MSRLVDQDTEQVVALLRDAVTTSELSQAGFARAMGTSPSRLSTYLTGQTRPSAWFCCRAQRLARALQATGQRGLMSAPATAAAMRQWSQAGETDWVWRMLLQGRDHLATILTDSDDTILGSWEAEPGSAGSIHWDALLAALAAHEYEGLEREPPAWTDVERLEEPGCPSIPS